MTGSQAEGLGGRVRSLEIQCRILQWLVALVTVGLALSLVRPGRGGPEQVEAGRFTLTDSEGHPRAVLGMQPDGEPCLRLLGRDGSDRVALSTDPSEAGALSFLERGQPRLTLSSSRYGFSGLYDGLDHRVLVDANRRPRSESTRLARSPRGVPAPRARDRRQEPSVPSPAGGSGSGGAGAVASRR